MTRIQLKPARIYLKVEDFEMDTFYANEKSLFYVYESYIDNKIKDDGKRFCYVRIKGENDDRSFSGMYGTLDELVKTLNSYSCRKAENLEIKENWVVNQR